MLKCSYWIWKFPCKLFLTKETCPSSDGSLFQGLTFSPQRNAGSPRADGESQTLVLLQQAAKSSVWGGLKCWNVFCRKTLGVNSPALCWPMKLNLQQRNKSDSRLLCYWAPLRVTLCNHIMEVAFLFLLQLLVTNLHHHRFGRKIKKTSWNGMICIPAIFLTLITLCKINT